ncbi:hypothetical protein SLE2022_050610 [Rubroshorea leprosula]
MTHRSGSRKKCDDGFGQWTDEIEYMDESGSVIYSGKGLRSVEPGVDDHVMVGELKKPFLNASAVAKIVEIVKRWKWGLELETQLDKLQFHPNMTHITQALKIIKESDASLNKAEKLEVSFCCFKKAQESGYKVDSQTFNTLMTLFLNKGLPFKAFEIYESMEMAGCLLDESTYELMIPNLAKSSRLDAASKPFQQMKEWKSQPSLSVLASLIDSMGKAGRLDASMKVYKEAQGCGLRSSSAMMYVSLIESFAKAGKLDSTLRLWDNMKKAGWISTYSSLLEMQAASGQVDSTVKLYNSITNAGLRPGLSNYTSPLTLLANKKLVDVAANVLLEMKSMGFSVDVRASDVLMVYIKDGSVDLALKWLSKASPGDLCELCCQSGSHSLHIDSCSFGIDYELKEGAARYFVNVLLNYLVLMGQINRGRPVWKVAYENKLFTEAIVFNQQIAWRIKLVTGPTLKIVVAQRLSSVESPFELDHLSPPKPLTAM